MGGDASLAFATLIYEQDKAGTPLTLDEVMVLNHLFLQKRADTVSIGELIQKGNLAAGKVLEKLLSRGLVSAKGEKRGRVYMLASFLYKKLGEPSGFVRARGFEPIQQEQMVLQYIMSSVD